MPFLFPEDVRRSFINHYQEQRPVDWSRHFGRDCPLDLEIGFGLGEFLIRQARSEPGRALVGLEQDWVRLTKTLRRIEQINQTAAVDQHLNNIRLLQVDATVALERLFVPRSLSRVFSLFPCPWPKKAHIKHRIFSRDFLLLLNSRLTEAGELLVVTDHRPYQEWMLAQAQETGFEIQSREIRPRFDTKFERKWTAQGQELFYELNFRKVEHHPVALQEDVPLQVYFVNEFQPDGFVFQNDIGEVSVIVKEYLADFRQGKAMLHLIVAEKTITQHFWVSLARTDQGRWCIKKAEGQTVLPTAGIAGALKLVHTQMLQGHSTTSTPSREE